MLWDICLAPNRISRTSNRNSWDRGRKRNWGRNWIQSLMSGNYPVWIVTDIILFGIWIGQSFSIAIFSKNLFPFFGRIENRLSFSAYLVQFVVSFPFFARSVVRVLSNHCVVANPIFRILILHFRHLSFEDFGQKSQLRNIKAVGTVNDCVHILLNVFRHSERLHGMHSAFELVQECVQDIVNFDFALVVYVVFNLVSQRLT